ASSAFYACNPRALYEGPMRNLLTEFGIPRGQSGPLNIAKATQMINEQWAAQRRGREIAESVVHLVSAIESMSTSDLYNFAIALHIKFLTQAQLIASLRIDVPLGV